MANIAEGFDRGSNKEFIQFLTYSLSSVSELKSHLYLAGDLGYLDATTSQKLMTQMESLSKRLNKLLKYLWSHKTPGKPVNRQTDKPQTNEPTN